MESQVGYEQQVSDRPAGHHLDVVLPAGAGSWLKFSAMLHSWEEFPQGLADPQQGKLCSGQGQRCSKSDAQCPSSPRRSAGGSGSCVSLS